MKDQARDFVILIGLFALLFAAFIVISSVIGGFQPSALWTATADPFSVLKIGTPQNDVTEAFDCNFHYDIAPMGDYCEIVLPDGSEPYIFVAVTFSNFTVRSISIGVLGEYLPVLIEAYGNPANAAMIQPGGDTAWFCWSVGVYASVTDRPGANDADRVFFSIYDPQQNYGRVC